jgi:hypothetical protein
VILDIGRSLRNGFLGAIQLNKKPNEKPFFSDMFTCLDLGETYLPQITKSRGT